MGQHSDVIPWMDKMTDCISFLDRVQRTLDIPKTGSSMRNTANWN